MSAEPLTSRADEALPPLPPPSLITLPPLPAGFSRGAPVTDLTDGELAETVAPTRRRATSPGVSLRVISPRDASTSIAACLELVDDALPGMSARHRLSKGQRIGLGALAVLVVLGLVVAPAGTAVVSVTAATLTYLLTLAFRVAAFGTSLRRDLAISITDAEALGVPDHELPTYTVLVPAFAEPRVMPSLVHSLEQLDYPRDRLDIKLLLEEGDRETLAAARALQTELAIEVLIVPSGLPQTKPRALNYGLLWSESDLVTVFDAEDRPEPLQLRRAAVAFADLDRTVACLQARLEFYDADRNLLTKWFTIEYLTWFRCFLPGLVGMGAPPPLGGTSNHFRREALEASGAWDPFNVTEDVDLGLRLNRIGYRVEALDSVTYEEANSDVVNWVKQRSRWQKGYLQTALVHLRNPRHARRQLGWRGLIHIVLFVGGTPVLAVTNLMFWALTCFWLATKAEFIHSIFPAPVYYLSVGSWIVGNLTIFYLGVVTLLVSERPKLLWAALLAPFYWVLMSIAGLRALIQLVTDPSHWEKTVHGLGVDENGRASVVVGREGQRSLTQ